MATLGYSSNDDQVQKVVGISSERFSATAVVATIDPVSSFAVRFWVSSVLLLDTSVEDPSISTSTTVLLVLRVALIECFYH